MSTDSRGVSHKKDTKWGWGEGTLASEDIGKNLTIRQHPSLASSDLIILCQLGTVLVPSVEGHVPLRKLLWDPLGLLS